MTFHTSFRTVTPHITRQRPASRHIATVLLSVRAQRAGEQGPVRRLHELQQAGLQDELPRDVCPRSRAALRGTGAEYEQRHLLRLLPAPLRQTGEAREWDGMAGAALVILVGW